MSYSLRPYQQEAVDVAIKNLRKGPDPVLMNLSMSSGKTWVVAEIAKQWGGKVLILTPTKELCEQDYAKLDIVMEGQGVGMYAASWKRKEQEHITVSIINSAYRHPELWEDYKLVIIDEVDQSSNIDGMLGTLIQGKHVLGVTGTAFGTVGSRNGAWYTTKIWPMHRIKTKTRGFYWKPICYNLSTKDLQDSGYCTPVKAYSSPTECWKLKIQSNGSEYTSDSVSNWVNSVLMRGVEVMDGAETHGMCKSGIVFMPSVEACNALEMLCNKCGLSVGVVHSKTPAKQRDDIVEKHKTGQIKWLINMNVATRGFDAPDVDCIVCMRPTNSLRLWNQMVGRGIRLSPNKTHCNLIDLTENTKRWGVPYDFSMGKDGWKDTIMLRGKDITGKQTSLINMNELRRKHEQKRNIDDVYGLGENLPVHRLNNRN